MGIGSTSTEHSLLFSNKLFYYFFFFQQITSSVTMSDNATSNYIKVNYFSKCLNLDGSKKQTNKCENIKVYSISLLMIIKLFLLKIIF